MAKKKARSTAAQNRPVESRATPDPAATKAHEPGTTAKPPPGLDAARQAAIQRTAQQADYLRHGVFPAIMAAALGLDNVLSSPAYMVFLERLRHELGDPKDPIEGMLIEQLALAHFRIAQLHVRAAQATGIEAAKIYNSVTARMLGEFRRTVLALRVYRTPLPEGKPEKNLKVYKVAQ